MVNVQRLVWSYHVKAASPNIIKNKLKNYGILQWDFILRVNDKCSVPACRFFAHRTRHVISTHTQNQGVWVPRSPLGPFQGRTLQRNMTPLTSKGTREFRLFLSLARMHLCSMYSLCLSSVTQRADVCGRRYLIPRPWAFEELLVWGYDYGGGFWWIQVCISVMDVPGSKTAAS